MPRPPVKRNSPKTSKKKPSSPAGRPAETSALHTGTPVVLPDDVTSAWKKALLKVARLPRGTNPKDYGLDYLVSAILRQELPEISRLWTIFNQERGELSRNLLANKRSAVAYLAGFHLANAARAFLTLNRAESRYRVAQVLGHDAEKIVWHDLGAGSGAIAQAVHAHLQCGGVKSENLSLHLYDATGALLDAARAVFDINSLPIKTHKVPLEGLEVSRLRAQDGEVTGYSLGYVWNELAKNPAARKRLLQLWGEQRDQKTLMLLLEPATQNLAREAMHLRDQLVELGFKPLYLCPTADHCPMLNLSRDWCYSEGKWKRPPAMVALDDALGMDRSRLSGALFYFASAPLAAQFAAAKNTRGIVVGRPKITGVGPNSPGFEYLVCRGDHLEKAKAELGKPCLARGLNVKP